MELTPDQTEKRHDGAAGRVVRELHFKTVVLITLFLVIHHVMLTVRVAAVSLEHQAEILQARTVLVPFAAMLCYGMFLVLRRFAGRSFLQQIAVGALLSALAATIHGTIWSLFLKDLDPVEYPGTLGNIAYQSLYWHLFYFSWTTAYLALCYSITVREQERRASALMAEAQEAKIRALRYQISPHFLFNTLNSIAALVSEDCRQAETMVLNLSEFFRATLAVDPLDEVRLVDEIALQELYLKIEQVRFPNRLSASITMPQRLAGALVPSLILQPLVENAVKHGVACSESPTRVEIRVAEAIGRLRLSVIDDSAKTSAASLSNGTGIGLGNVRNRLRARYGDEGVLFAAGDKGKGFTATIELPLRFAQ